MSAITAGVRRTTVCLVAAVVAAAIGPLTGVAAASHVAGLDLTPAASSAAAGTCVLKTVVLNGMGGSDSVADQRIDVVLTERSPSPDVDADFCVEPTGSTTPQAPLADSTVDEGPGGMTDRTVYVAGASGGVWRSVTFGVTSSAPGGADVLVFAEDAGSTTDNGVRDGAEPSATATVDFGPGGPAGSSAVADAAASIACTAGAHPCTDVVGHVGEPVAFGLVVRNASALGGAQTLRGVTITVQPINDAPSAAAGPLPTCPMTDNSGLTTCTYTPSAAGTDRLRFFVNQSDGATSGYDAGAEPSADATISVAAARGPVLLVVSCAPGAADDASARSCVNRTDDPTQALLLTATEPDGPDADLARDPAADLLVSWTLESASANGSLSERTCRTNTEGMCSVTLSVAAPTVVDRFTVTARITGVATDPSDPSGNVAELSFTAPTSASPTASPNITLNGCEFGSQRLTLAANATRITAGNAPKLSGVVTGSEGNACPGVDVHILGKRYGAATYTLVSRVTADDAGRFSLVVRPSVQTSYGANSADGTSRSPVISIRVSARVTITAPGACGPSPCAPGTITVALGDVNGDGTDDFASNGTFQGRYDGHEQETAPVAFGLGTFRDDRGRSCRAGIRTTGQVGVCRFRVIQQTTSTRGVWRFTTPVQPGWGIYVVFVSPHGGQDGGSASVSVSVS